MKSTTQNKVQQYVRTDEGWLFIFNSDFAEGGTAEEAEINLVRRIAVAKRLMREAIEIPFHYTLVDNFNISIGLN